MANSFLVLATLAVGGVLLRPGRADAHALHADVTVATEIALVAYFDDDTPAGRAEAVVTDPTGRVILRGITDERGRCTFPRPDPGAYVLTVTSAGHAARVEFAVGGAGAPPAGFLDPRPDQARGLALGAGGLLVLSIAVLFVRRGKRVQ